MQVRFLSSAPRRSKVRFAPIFFCKENHPPAPLLLFRKRSRAGLFACKRAHYPFAALTTFCGLAPLSRKRYLFRSGKTSRNGLRFIQKARPKPGLSHTAPSFLFVIPPFYRRSRLLGCSLVNALAASPPRYQPFADIAAAGKDGIFSITGTHLGARPALFRFSFAKKINRPLPCPSFPSRVSLSSLIQLQAL